MEFAPIGSPRRAATLGLALISLLLVSCGGGGGGSSPPPPPPPPAALSYTSPQVYVVGQAITPLKPSINVTGGLSGFSSFPALPIGLTLDETTGIISGTPTYVRATNDYQIRATSPSGQGASATVTITVNAVPANVISYGSPRFTFTAGVAARTLTPATAVGVTAWSISPQLPSGLTFNDGSISGTPTAASPPTVYTVTAQTASVPLTVNLTIDVQSAVLVDLGHNTGVAVTQFNGSSVLSEDWSGHWVLWNYGNATLSASGDSDCIPNVCAGGPTAALAGSVAVIRKKTGFEVLSAGSGASLGTITASFSWWNLATDGSYIVAGSSTALSAWTASGQLLVSRPGNYASAMSFASPAAIRIASGPAGANVIETVSVPSGADTVSATFNGQFTAWFLDGSAFTSTAGSTVLIYSNATVQEAVVTNPAGPIAGEGAWFWIFTGSLSVYALNSPVTPVVTYTFAGNTIPVAVPSASTIGVIQNYPGDTVSIIDLSGAAPVRTDYASPFGVGNNMINTYSAASASKWVIGYASGVLIDGASLPGTPRYFGYGQALSIAGGTDEIAVATASGVILYFDATTLAQQGTIAFSSGQLALSSDGSTLAAAPNQLPAQGFASQSLNIYSMPAASLLYSWPYPFSSNVSVNSIALSGSGNVLAQVLTNGTLLVGSPTGGAPIYTGSAGTARLSPDGTLVATSATSNPETPISGTNAAFGTNIVQNGMLITAILGWPVGWIDNGHLLVNSYQPNYVLPGFTDYIGCMIYGPTGQATGTTCDLPEVLGFQTLASDTLYALNLNAIVSVSTGTVSWMSGDPVAPGVEVPPNSSTLVPLDTLAGSHVVFVSGSRVVAQSY